jgi:acetoin utilization deacetylase AcuC-like enzyme
MKKIAVARHPLFLAHRNDDEQAPWHPESPDRLKVVNAALDAASDLTPHLTFLEPREATREELEAVHDWKYLDWLEKASAEAARTGGIVPLDLDTCLNQYSLPAAKLAAGTAMACVEALKTTDAVASFALVRPPGHHAAWRLGQGACLINNIALAAHLCLKWGDRRVGVLDWDVHHGNGTEDIFKKNRRVFVANMHRWEQWPGSGGVTDDGIDEGKYYNVNGILPAGTRDHGYLALLDQVLLKMLLEYKPSTLLVSAGYDAHWQDPVGGLAVGGMGVTTAGFAAMTARVRALAEMLGIKVGFFLEGGYHPASLADSVLATMRAYLGIETEQAGALEADQNPAAVAQYIATVRNHFSQARQWRHCLSKAA